jgi:uncharacterized protein YceH (UPF0502 family)
MCEQRSEGRDEAMRDVRVRTAGRSDGDLAHDDAQVRAASERLLRMMRLFGRRHREAQQVAHAGDALVTMSAPAFRAVVAARLESLERDLAEVRARINGLLFVVVGAVVTQVVLRVVGG